MPPALAAWNYYRWNGAWGYLRLDALNLYYVHGRWYNPETALWLSPDENGEYLYGSGQDAVNKGWARDDFNTWALGAKLSPLPPMTNVQTKLIAAMAAVGESGVYCDNTKENCYVALGSIIWVARNRLWNCREKVNCGIAPDPRFTDEDLKTGHWKWKVTLANILTASCQNSKTGCTQFQGLEHWIQVPGKPNRCNLTRPSECLSLTDPDTRRKLAIALEAANDIFGTSQEKMELFRIWQLVGPRKYFGTGDFGKQECAANNSPAMPCNSSSFGSKSQAKNPTYFWDHP